MRKIEMTGLVFGDLTVIRESDFTRSGKVYWHCVCKCGREVDICGGNLRSGNSTSCRYCGSHGMKWKHATTKNGEWRRLYVIWIDMKKRTEDITNKEYMNYGGRGISVCDEWTNNFDSFAEWADNNGYSDDLTIDRIDNNSGYSPENCRWVDMKTNQNNKRCCRYVEIDGERMTVKQAAEKYGVPYRRTLYRLTNGMSAKDAIFTKPRTNQWR